jgi:hypothetical protein
MAINTCQSRNFVIGYLRPRSRIQLLSAYKVWTVSSVPRSLRLRDVYGSESLAAETACCSASLLFTESLLSLPLPGRSSSNSQRPARAAFGQEAQRQPSINDPPHCKSPGVHQIVWFHEQGHTAVLVLESQDVRRRIAVCDQQVFAIRRESNSGWAIQLPVAEFPAGRVTQEDIPAAIRHG